MDCSLQRLRGHDQLTYKGLENIVDKRNTFVSENSLVEKIANFIKQFPCYEDHINEKSHTGKTWFDKAVKHNNTPIIKALNLLKTNRDSKDNSTQIDSLIHIPSQTSEEKFLDFFDQCMKENNFKKLAECEETFGLFLITFEDSRTGQNLLHRGIEKGASLKFIRYLLKEMHICPERTDNQGKTAYHYMAAYRRPDIFFLDNYGPKDIEGLRDNDEQNAFHQAAIHGCLEILWFALKDYKTQFKEKYNLLQLAAIHGQTAVVSCILDSKFADKFFDFSYHDNRNNKRHSPLYLAAKHGHFGAFVKLYTSPWVTDDERSKAQEIASKKPHDKIVLFCQKMVIENLPMLSYEDLEARFIEDSGRFIDYLHTQMELGANLDVLIDGKTLLDCAVENENIKILDILLTHCNASPFITSGPDKYNPLDRAIMKNWVEGIEYLIPKMRAVNEYLAEPQPLIGRHEGSISKPFINHLMNKRIY